FVVLALFFALWCSFFFSSRRRHTRSKRDWSSDVCSSDLGDSGPAALVKNMRVFSIASFACIGGVLYGYNQGMFSGVLAMASFQRSEERRVGKECRSRCARDHYK